MKKIIIVFMSITLLFTLMSCDFNAHDDSKEMAMILLMMENAKRNSQSNSNSSNEIENEGEGEGESPNTNEDEEETTTSIDVDENRTHLSLNYIMVYDNNSRNLRSNNPNDSFKNSPSFLLEEYSNDQPYNIVLLAEYANGKLTFSTSELRNSRNFYHVENVRFNSSTSTVYIYVTHN